MSFNNIWEAVVTAAVIKSIKVWTGEINGNKIKVSDLVSANRTLIQKLCKCS